MNNLPNMHNKSLRPNKYVYTVTIYNGAGTVVAGGCIDSYYPILNATDYKNMSDKAKTQMGIGHGIYTVILNIINSPNWR